MKAPSLQRVSTTLVLVVIVIAVKFIQEFCITLLSGKDALPNFSNHEKFSALRLNFTGRFEVHPHSLVIWHLDCVRSSAHSTEEQEEDEGPYTHPLACSSAPTSLEDEPFGPRLSSELIMQQEDLLRLVIDLFDAMNSSLFAVSGTLVGLLRHGMIVPWDDDLDFASPIGDALPVFAVLDAPNYANDSEVAGHPIYRRLSTFALARLWWEKSSPSFTPSQWKQVQFFQSLLDVQLYDTILEPHVCGKIILRSTGWKIPTSSESVEPPVSFPFVDIWCTLLDFETRTAVKQSLTKQYWSFDEIFPIRYMPFGNISIPVPNDPLAVIRKQYPNFFVKCVSNTWDHLREVSAPRRVMDCADLYNVTLFLLPLMSGSRRVSAIPHWLLEAMGLTSSSFGAGAEKEEKDARRRDSLIRGFALDVFGFDWTHSNAMYYRQYFEISGLLRSHDTEKLPPPRHIDEEKPLLPDDDDEEGTTNNLSAASPRSAWTKANLAAFTHPARPATQVPSVRGRVRLNDENFREIASFVYNLLSFPTVSPPADLEVEVKALKMGPIHVATHFIFREVH